MYLPQIFHQTDPKKLIDLIQTHPLGTLISLKDGVPQVDHLPFYLVQKDDQYQLVAHFAKANPLAQYVDGQEVLVVFMGEQGYISPNWYPSKHIHHRHVPTWNYQTVHVRGTAQLFDDKKSLMRAVGTLTNIHESTQSTPWKLKDAPADYVAQELQAVVGLVVSVGDMVGKFKLSQNREQADFKSVVANLRQEGQTPLAQAMADVKTF